MTEDQQMNDMVEVVEVTQADRDAARNIALSLDIDDWAGPGSYFGQVIAQIIARHRIAHSPGDGMVVVPSDALDRVLEMITPPCNVWTGEEPSWQSHAFCALAAIVEQEADPAMIAAAGQGDGR